MFGGSKYICIWVYSIYRSTCIYIFDMDFLRFGVSPYLDTATTHHSSAPGGPWLFCSTSKGKKGPGELSGLDVPLEVRING